MLLGPSGCGKTTLLSIIGGFLTPTEGSVSIGGVDVTALPPARRPTTTVFQDYALFPHMTLGANVGFGLRMRGAARTECDARACESGTYEVPAAPATRIVAGGDVIDLGNRHFEVIHTPGHSPGGIALWEADTGICSRGISSTTGR